MHRPALVFRLRKSPLGQAVRNGLFRSLVSGALSLRSAGAVITTRCARLAFDSVRAGERFLTEQITLVARKARHNLDHAAQALQPLAAITPAAAATSIIRTTKISSTTSITTTGLRP